MRTSYWFITGTLLLLLGGCAVIDAAPAPEMRQALAPTGSRVAPGESWPC